MENWNPDFVFTIVQGLHAERVTPAETWGWAWAPAAGGDTIVPAQGDIVAQAAAIAAAATVATSAPTESEVLVGDAVS